MLDIKFIIENQKLVEEGIAKKGLSVDIPALIALHLDINKLKTSSQALAEEKNRLSNSIKSASAEERPAIIAKSKALGEELKVELEKLAVEQKKFDDIMWRMPNLPSPESPVGADDSENVVRRRVGEPTKFDFTPRDHVELMELNGWSEMERITKVCGSRTYAITGELARLELAIHLLVMDKLAENGFRVITVPSLSKEKPLYGQGYLPFARDEIYYMPEDDLYLSGTAELILNSLRADEIIPEQMTPQIDIDAVLDLQDINSKFMSELKKMNPFGPDNQKPVFCSLGVKDYGTSKLVGKDLEHIKLELIDDKSNTPIHGIAFGMHQHNTHIKNMKPFNICYTIEENTYNGNTSLQLMVKDIKENDI